MPPSKVFGRNSPTKPSRTKAMSPKAISPSRGETVHTPTVMHQDINKRVSLAKQRLVSAGRPVRQTPIV